MITNNIVDLIWQYLSYKTQISIPKSPNVRFMAKRSFLILGDPLKIEQRWELFLMLKKIT